MKKKLLQKFKTYKIIFLLKYNKLINNNKMINSNHNNYKLIIL